MIKPPHCMKEGGLKFLMQWMKWQIENVPMKESYDNKRKELKEAKRLANMSFRYKGL